jgi:hypothetical protein
MYMLFFPHPAINEASQACFENTVRREYQKGGRYKSRRMGEEWCDNCRSDELSMRSPLDRFNMLWAMEEVQQLAKVEWYKDVKHTDLDLLIATANVQAIATSTTTAPTQEALMNQVRIIRHLLAQRNEMRSVRKAQLRVSKSKSTDTVYADGIGTVVEKLVAAAATNPINLTNDLTSALYKAVALYHNSSSSLPVDALVAAAATTHRLTDHRDAASLLMGLGSAGGAGAEDDANGADGVYSGIDRNSIEWMCQHKPACPFKGTYADVEEHEKACCVGGASVDGVEQTAAAGEAGGAAAAAAATAT